MTENEQIKGRSGAKEDKADPLKILNIRGELYHTRLTKKFEQKSKWEKPDEKHLMSHIPGTICKIFVKPGDIVDMHSKLMILEAMKMENIIFSPIEGRIKTVRVKEGEKVRKGVLMVEFE
jgi:biotin carboxyl carrier protein